MRPSTRKWLLFLLAIAVWYGASTRLPSLNRQRAEYHLTLPPLSNELAPSALLTPLLAVGRAPLVDYYWLRATKLKEEGRYFDALQLSQRICELQPKFAAVWAFQAWNMAYNISVALKAPEERWRWVRNGYELIRDKGIPLNPNNAQLYKELSWILFHKVGDFMDDWHFYYKNELAKQMEDVLGEPPADFVKPGVVRGDFYRDYDFQALADAPKRYRDLIADPAVHEMAEVLSTYGFDCSKNKVFTGLIKAIRDDKLEMPDTPEHLQIDRKHAFLSYFNDPKLSDAKRKMEVYWRSWRLRNEEKFDPARIVELQKSFGITLDFRLAETQALYWANLGVEMGTDKREALDIHKLNSNRIEFYCLQKMFHRGRLAMSPNAAIGEPPLLEPDLRVIPSLFKAFINDSERYKDMEKEKKPVSENFRTGFVGFMRSAILRYHEAGLNDKAEELFKYLSDNYPDPMYKGGLNGFLTLQMIPDRELADYRVTAARVEAMVGRGIQNYSHDEDEQAVRYFSRARDLFDRYQKNALRESQRFPPGAFDEMVVAKAHQIGGYMPRSTYERLCAKLKIQPLPEAPPTTQPAAGQ